MSNTRSSRGSDLSTRIGFFLWRGGLAFCACYVAYRSFATVAELLLEIGVPLQIVIGFSLVAFGLLLLIASLIIERVIDARIEGQLLDE